MTVRDVWQKVPVLHKWGTVPPTRTRTQIFWIKTTTNHWRSPAAMTTAPRKLLKIINNPLCCLFLAFSLRLGWKTTLKEWRLKFPKLFVVVVFSVFLDKNRPWGFDPSGFHSAFMFWSSTVFLWTLIFFPDKSVFTSDKTATVCVCVWVWVWGPHSCHFHPNTPACQNNNCSSFFKRKKGNSVN